MDRTEPLSDLANAAEVADLWTQLRVAADQGDQQAESFLRCFEPFARARQGRAS